MKVNQTVKVRFSADNKSGLTYKEATVLNIYPALNQLRIEIEMPDGSKLTRLVAQQSVFPIKKVA